MKILITGHQGFIGRHFVKKLHDDNNSIIGVDIKPLINNEGEEIPGCDCRDFFRNSTEQFDLVIHCAAIVGGRTKIEGDPIALAADLAIDAEMFQWAVRTKQTRIVYFSSSAAYPIALQDTPGTLHESDISLYAIRNPDMVYGWAKLTGEMLAEYARLQGVNVHVFRPFSGYGEDQDLDYPFPTFIARAKEIAANKKKKFEIWGTGMQERDFIHVDDIVNAVMKAVELDIQTPINLGTGRATNFRQLAALCMDEAGTNVALKLDETKPIGVQYRVSDNTKLLEFYIPTITLEEGIKRALHNETN